MDTNSSAQMNDFTLSNKIRLFLYGVWLVVPLFLQLFIVSILGFTKFLSPNAHIVTLILAPYANLFDPQLSISQIVSAFIAYLLITGVELIPIIFGAAIVTKIKRSHVVLIGTALLTGIVVLYAIHISYRQYTDFAQGFSAMIDVILIEYCFMLLVAILPVWLLSYTATKSLIQVVIKSAVIGLPLSILLGILWWSIISTSTLTPAASQQITPTPTVTSSSQIDCAQTTKQIYLDKKNNKIFLKDSIHKFQLDVTTLPQIQIEDTLPCANKYYEVDMYTLRTSPYAGSVARFSVSAPIRNDAGSSLEQYARNELHYVSGVHVGNNYGQQYTSSPITTTTLPSGVEELTWSDKFTDQETYQEGLTAVKQYLLFVNNTFYDFRVSSWDIPSFNKATDDFDTVIKTFQLTNSSSTK